MSDPEPSPLDLSKFKEKMCPAGNHQALDVFAYRMDGNDKIKPMATYADLGTPSCCDYLYIDNNKTVLIEDTHLGKQIKNFFKLELKPSTEEQREKEFKKLLRQENCLKVYGALLILCRLAEKHKHISKELKGKEFSFWFVINDEEDIKAMDNMEVVDFLKKTFKTALGGTLSSAKLVRETKVLFLSELRKELQFP